MSAHTEPQPGYGPDDFEDPPERLVIPAGNGLVLKQLFVEDAQAYFDLLEQNRAHLRQEFEGGADDTAEKYPDVNSVVLSIQHPQNTDRLRLGIWDGETMVGSINITPEEGHKAEIGYWIGYNHTGHGFAAHATRALAEHAFKKDDELVEIYGNVFVGNWASDKTLRNAGFQFDGTFSRIDSKTHKLERLWHYTLRR